MLGVKGENEYIGRGVSYCAVCDAAFFRDKKVVLVGGGDAAMEDALALMKFAREVHLMVRSDVLRASKIMQERVLAHEKVRVSWNTQVKEVFGDGKKMTGVKLYQSTTQSEIEMEADGLFVAIGHDPVTGFLDGQVTLNPKGYVSTRLGLDTPSVALATAHISPEGLVQYPTMTSVEGVFAAGDNVDFRYRQASTAAGMGTMAALDAIWWLERN
jgi:thioredoxin reductase (NADPH)